MRYKKFHIFLKASEIQKIYYTSVTYTKETTYFHSISWHATDQYRLFSGRSANTEKQGAFFTSIKTDTKLISNSQPENLITNAIIKAETRTVVNQVVHVKEIILLMTHTNQLKSSLKIQLYLFHGFHLFPVNTRSYLNDKQIFF